MISSTNQDTQDPWQVLGVSPDAGASHIRAAYLDKIKAFPPDREAVKFQEIRWAYEQLNDPHRRSKRIILGEAPDAPLTSLLDRLSGSTHRYVGPEPWLAALRDQKKKD